MIKYQWDSWLRIRNLHRWQLSTINLLIKYWICFPIRDFTLKKSLIIAAKTLVEYISCHNDYSNMCHFLRISLKNLGLFRKKPTSFSNHHFMPWEKIHPSFCTVKKIWNFQFNLHSCPQIQTWKRPHPPSRWKQRCWRPERCRGLPHGAQRRCDLRGVSKKANEVFDIFFHTGKMNLLNYSLRWD